MLFEHSFFFLFFFGGGGGGVSIAHLVEVTDSAMLGGVVEVVRSKSTVGHENIFSAISGTFVLLSLSIYIYRERERG